MIPATADELEAVRSRLARYRLRVPVALEKMTYDAPTGSVIYRSKMHAGLKRNFQLIGLPSGFRALRTTAFPAGLSKARMRPAAPKVPEDHDGLQDVAPGFAGQRANQ